MRADERRGALWMARVGDTYRRRREPEEDSAVEKRLVSVENEPNSESKADGEEPDGVNEPALVVIVVVSSLVVVTH